jgi:hypothetical protein
MCRRTRYDALDRVRTYVAANAIMNAMRDARVVSTRQHTELSFTNALLNFRIEC